MRLLLGQGGGDDYDVTCMTLYLNVWFGDVYLFRSTVHFVLLFFSCWVGEREDWMDFFFYNEETKERMKGRFTNERRRV